MLQEHESGWWKGESHGVVGLFPVTYCEECAGPDYPTAATTASPPVVPVRKDVGKESPAASLALAAQVSYFLGAICRRWCG